MYGYIEVISKSEAQETLEIRQGHIEDVKRHLVSQGFQVSEDDVKLAILFAANYRNYPNEHCSTYSLLANAIDVLGGIVRGTEFSKDFTLS
jgi:hypothetical protein